MNALEDASNATLLHHAAVNSKMRVLECVHCDANLLPPLEQSLTGIFLVGCILLCRFLFADPVLQRTIRVDALGGELQTTPLFWAAYHNHIYAVELLLRNGADAGFLDAAGFNAFLLSIQVGNGRHLGAHLRALACGLLTIDECLSACF